MAESPVLTLARLLGGVVLMHGRLGHQILGQMLVMGSNEVAVAGAIAVVAATDRQRNAVVQMALRTAAPALAVRGLLQKQEKRIDWKETLIAERERRVEERERELETRQSATEAPRFERTAAKISALEEEIRQLQGERERLSARLRSIAKRPPVGSIPRRVLPVPPHALASSQLRPPTAPQQLNRPEAGRSGPPPKS